jgi:hypothetical protein
VVVWQRFETFRNRLPLVDHSLIADAEATDLPETYCSSTVMRFLVQVMQLSPGEAASRVRAAAAVGPRKSMLGEQLEPMLPELAALQRTGVVTPEKVQIVERAMHKLSRPGLHPDDEQLLTQYAPLLGPVELRRYALQVVNADDPDGPEPLDDQRQHNRRHVELKQRRDVMWHLQDHFLRKGWTCRLNIDGLPEWIPPWWIDRNQRPQINARIRRLHAQRHEHPRWRRQPYAA